MDFVLYSMRSFNIVPKWRAINYDLFCIPLGPVLLSVPHFWWSSRHVLPLSIFLMLLHLLLQFLGFWSYCIVKQIEIKIINFRYSCSTARCFSYFLLCVGVLMFSLRVPYLVKIVLLIILLCPCFILDFISVFPFVSWLKLFNVWLVLYL